MKSDKKRNTINGIVILVCMALGLPLFIFLIYLSSAIDKSVVQPGFEGMAVFLKVVNVIGISVSVAILALTWFFSKHFRPSWNKQTDVDIFYGTGEITVDTVKKIK